MVILMPTLSGYGSVQHVPVSLALVPALVDGEKYLMPDDVPQPEIRDLRRLRREKAPRAPSMRTLVRWALRCDNAEQLGHRLRVLGQ
ncbi:hypothetical protein [Bradyrhizobium sp. S3.5.5]|uniref:hypothetical protein n=1 Tax=Bradyrhizobium sp. S3.5.5 TaxID=3156430 RepID=UPI003399D869